MTSMDTDSESQDSDDGRRFRFEATRKDAAIIPDTVSKEKSPRKKSKHRSHLEDKSYHDRKERSKHETNRKESQRSRERDIDEKESRHIVKHAKYGMHKDYRGTKESDSASGEKNLKYSMDSKERSRDLKHSRERDRNDHRKHSRERSRDRSYDDRSSVDRYRSKYHDRHKYSRHKSRDRSCQSNRLRSSDNEKSRSEHGRHESIKKTKDKRLQHLENEHSAHENVDQIHDDNGSHSMSLTKVCKAATPLDIQDCKDLDLSDFDVLSETDENVSDISDSRSLCSSSYYHKTKVRREHLKSQYECVNKKQVAPDQEHVEELQKVNCKNSITLLSSSNNNPSAISDTLLDFISLEPTSIMNKQMKSLQEKDAECDTLESSEKTNTCAYGPVLPPQLKTFNEQKSTNVYTSLCTEQHESKKNIVKDISDKDNITSIDFIGPCLPKIENTSDNYENSNIMSALNLEEENQEHQEPHSPSKNIDESMDDIAAFGPALPPHLIKQKQNEEDTKSRLIGPIIPEDIKLLNEEERMALYSQFEDEDTVTSSLIHHSTANNGHTYQELQTPGIHYFHEIKQDIAEDVVHKREKWMMELPPARAADFGLRARKFRLRPGPDMSDRSCWTDTPVEKARKRKSEEETAALRSVDKSDCIELLKEKSKKTKKQEKSLLEIHQSKLKKKRKKEEKEAKAAGLPTRRPFDRNIDLQVNRFMDHSQKRSVLMKAEMLNDRFSRGQI
ncbi:hypothetical protein HZH66_004956 [Vespula vulgaris]|uniref:DUF3752 domain-containing protein n=1 Tax=Vespula vulgaris TaxID=7454 RepID=A0A834KD76_VESVU|nr:serine/threonine-protein kinase prpf4B [Vespula vulgaris]XP_050848660.1 serine/threonine-protein kinase prpf4B [Vespula vulgaris]XP_050848661.1 serine/threonine-protein kinase prpf4B [Vespula vulgaris]XP_050848662.1 serine/threonine-protein kinase prpf4B [Vespula vulgaris]KAF7402689.1 hypothetical protein HZH66_004956 [Vespula vulgaris]